jgi:hypothetical protein
MTGPRSFPLLALLPALLLLGGCGDEVKKTFGLGKNPPDEFQVVRRAPLALPPDFSLRPPQPGAARPQETALADQARRTVLEQDQAAAAAPPRPVDPAAPAAAPRTPVTSSGMSVGGALALPSSPAAARAGRPAPQLADPLGPSQAELSLLKHLGADRTPPNIRAVINEDLTKMADADTRFIDRLLVWRKSSEPPASVLDARKEAQRLQENAALGKPATEGETPTIKRRTKSIFAGLF